MANPVPEIRNTAFPQRRPAARGTEDFARWFNAGMENEDEAGGYVPILQPRTSLEDLIFLQEESVPQETTPKIVDAYERVHVYDERALHGPEAEPDGQYVFEFMNEPHAPGEVLNEEA